MRRRTRRLLGLTLGLGLAAAALWGPSAPAQGPGGAILFSELTLSSAIPELGGLSGVETAADGASLIALSDRGYLIFADLDRAEGPVSGARVAAVATLLDITGARPEATEARDSEGLAVTGDGRIFVSYEGVHRVLEHSPDGRAIAQLPGNPAFRRLPANGSLESLAIDGQGRFLTLPERARGMGRQVPVFRYDGSAWDQRLSVRRHGRFQPVGLDTDDLGRLYLLERSFRPIIGFATRIRRFHLTEAGLAGEETLLETRPGRHSNLEGISLWRREDGQLVATMVSDDNFSSILSMQIVEYLLPE